MQWYVMLKCCIMMLCDFVVIPRSLPAPRALPPHSCEKAIYDLKFKIYHCHVGRKNLKNLKSFSCNLHIEYSR